MTVTRTRMMAATVAGPSRTSGAAWQATSRALALTAAGRLRLLQVAGSESGPAAGEPGRPGRHGHRGTVPGASGPDRRTPSRSRDPESPRPSADSD